MVQSLLRRFEHVIQQLKGADLEQALSDIDIMTEQDLGTIWDWNRTVPVSIDKTVHSIIEGWAEKQPNAPAICAWDGEFTYGELDKYATKLARRLVNAGVGPRTLLPLCFEKSRWTPVAILATLKAGAAFVLLDPALPEKRLQTIVRQVQASLILTSPSNQTLSSRLAQAVITVNEDMLRESFESQSMIHVLPETGPSSDMYVVFTSGSTGTPKGVTIQHRNLSSALYHQARDHGVTAASRVFDFASYSFDASIINMFMALAAGACLCVPSDEDRKNDLAGCIRSLRATIAHLTPSVAQFLVPDEVPELQTIILAGEAVRVRDVERWWGKVNVFNIYGPSECTPFSTINHCTTTLEAATGIGKGSGQVTWVVDPRNHDRLVPIGCIGELLLEGPLVGAGYIGEPEKTGAAFIQDPTYLLRGMPSRRQAGRQGRLYKTGDLVRYNGDGSLVFVGRKDDQVKIRGQRVELGEVEHCIQQHMKQVKQVVAEVIIPRGQDARPTLAAFAHLGDDDDNSTGSEATILDVGGDLERTLATHLPHYMVPTVFFSMRELPMTATGKTNRKRLREIGGSLTVEELAEMRRTAVHGMKTKTKPPPASRLERLLQGIWSLVLGMESASIGRDDNFFQLGGDSIGTMQMVGAARKVDVSLSVAQIFRHPTLRSLAESLNNTLTVNRPGSDDVGCDYDESPLVDPHVMEGLLSEINSSHLHLRSDAAVEILPITQFQHDKVARGFNDPRQFCNYFYLDLGHDVDLSDLKRNCSVTLQRYPILRAYFLPFRGQFWQVIPQYQPDHIPFTIQDVDQGLDQAFLDFCTKDIEEVSPTDLAMQFLLLRHTEQGIRFVLRLSHAQYDGISLPTIVRSLLGTRSEDWTLSTPPDFSDFLAYAHRQRLKSRAYWKELLQGSSITRSASLLAPKQKTVQDVEAIEIEAEISLPRLPSNITPASLLSSAWAVLLSRITGKDNVVYGRLVAGRNAAIEGVEDIVGPCANIVPVRVNMSLLQTPADLLAYVQEQFIALGEADSLGLRDISENCTNWPVDSTLDSIIQHQNVDEHPEFQVAGVINSMNGFRNPHNIDRSLYMMSHPHGDRLRIELFANSHIMAAETAHVLLDSLCAVVQKLASCPDVPLQVCLEEIVVDLT
jgi:amino acid adenylation domain-containing protein